MNALFHSWRDFGPDFCPDCGFALRGFFAFFRFGVGREEDEWHRRRRLRLQRIQRVLGDGVERPRGSASQRLLFGWFLQVPRLQLANGLFHRFGGGDFCQVTDGLLSIRRELLMGIT